MQFLPRPGNMMAPLDNSAKMIPKPLPFSTHPTLHSLTPQFDQRVFLSPHPPKLRPAGFRTEANEVQLALRMCFQYLIRSPWLAGNAIVIAEAFVRQNVKDLRSSHHCGGLLHRGRHGFESTGEANEAFLRQCLRLKHPSIHHLLEPEVISFALEVHEIGDARDPQRHGASVFGKEALQHGSVGPLGGQDVNRLELTAPEQIGFRDDRWRRSERNEKNGHP